MKLDSCRGFTLLELLMALAIFALAGTAIMKAASEHMLSISILEETTIATVVANNRLAEVHIEKQWPPQNNRKGKEGMAGRTWHWRQSVVETLDDKMRAVTVEVRLDPNDQSAIFSVTSYVGEPSNG